MILNKQYLILWLVLIINFSAIATQTESMDNYGFLAELNLTDNESMLSRVELNKQIYLQVTSPNLNDLRVFNCNGKSVPFTLINASSKQQNIQQFNLNIYSISTDNLDNQIIVNNGDDYQAAINKYFDVNVDKHNSKRSGYKTMYLLQMANGDEKISPLISNLALKFANHNQKWQASVNILYSADLKHWDSVIADEPIMALSNQDDQKLSLTNISFQPNYNAKLHNWLVILYSQKPIPALIQVVATSSKGSINNTLLAIDLNLDILSEQEAIYTLPTAVAAKQLSIDIQDIPSILPISLFYKTNIQDHQWIKFDNFIIRKTDAYDEPLRLPFDVPSVAAIKLESIESSFERAPKLSLYRNKMDLVFNSTNDGPFILAWGAKDVEAAALPSTKLLSALDSVQSLPIAFVGRSMKPTGANKTKLDDSNKTSSFRHWAIWFELMTCALLLLLIILRLLIKLKQRTK